MAFTDTTETIVSPTLQPSNGHYRMTGTFDADLTTAITSHEFNFEESYGKVPIIDSVVVDLGASGTVSHSITATADKFTIYISADATHSNAKIVVRFQGCVN